MAAPLEGNYLFCINPELESFSDADFRNDLKAFVSGETEVLFDAGLPHMTLSVCKTDYPLLRYATALCERLTAAGADVTLKQHSETMLRSRAINGRYQLLLVSENMLDATALPDADILLLSAEEMEDPHAKTEHHSLRSATFHLSASWADGQFYVAGHQFRGRKVSGMDRRWHSGGAHRPWAFADRTDIPGFPVRRKLYGKQNALFWARRTSGLAILLMLFSILACSAECRTAYTFCFRSQRSGC